MKTGRVSCISFKKAFCLLGMDLGCFTTASASVQETSSTAIPRATSVQATAPMFSDAELDQMLAPIALYPDVLLTQTLIASTYPAEAIEAGNWLKANPDLRGKEAVEAAGQTNWDDSIKALTAFPEILVPMADHPDWTTGLGNAFLSQQQQLMNRVQFLRQKAKEQGNLQTNEQVTVQTTEQKTIVIEPATTQIVYVPYYNPTVVYGPWWWPAYTPVYWNPWPYAGYATGYSSGFMWSGVGLWFSYTSYRPVYDWHYHRVYIVDRHHHRHGPHKKPGPGREWAHKPEHRHDVPYHDKTYRPGLNTPKPGQHGVPNRKPGGQNRPHDMPGGNHMPGKHDRPSPDKNNRPGSPQMGLTDRNQEGSRPGPSRGKPFDIPRKDHTLTGKPPSNGQGHFARPGMSGNHPSANRPENGNPALNNPVNRPEANRPAGMPSNSQQGQGHSLNRPGSNRPMLIPDTGKPVTNRPLQNSMTNRPMMNRPSVPPMNRPTGNPPIQRPSPNRPAANRPVPDMSGGRPAISGPTSRPQFNRPVDSRPTPGPSLNRPVPTVRPVTRPPAGISAIRPAVGRPSPSVSRPVPMARPVSRPSSSHQSRPSSPGRVHGRGHGR